MGLKLSPHHQTLLAIVFGMVHLREVRDTESIPLKNVDEATLELMTDLVKIEFNASLQKEINNVEEGTKESVPNPYDVFVVEPTFRNNNIHIAVAVPIRTEDISFLQWYDVNGNLWDLDDLVATRKVSSLSGTVRILDNLTATGGIPILMKQAMSRTNLFDASTLESGVSDEVASVDRMNVSQNMAVLAVKSGIFNSGFFVVQGPPGTGMLSPSSALVYDSSMFTSSLSSHHCCNFIVFCIDVSRNR
jgi:hypothetical protein